MSELIAVEGLTIDHSSGSLVSGGTFTITSIASTKVKSGGNGAYKTSIVFTFAGGTHSSGTSETAIGGGTITATATKVKVEGGYVMRLGDSGTMNGTYTSATSPFPIVAFSSSVEITDANQDKVKAE